LKIHELGSEKQTFKQGYPKNTNTEAKEGKNRP